MRRWGASAAFVAVALLAAACSDDDAADPTTTPVTESTAASGDDRRDDDVHDRGRRRHVELDDDDHDPAPPTTQSVDQLKAEIEAAYRDLDAKGYALLRNPTLDGLDAKVAEIAIPGQPVRRALGATRVTQLVQNGQYLVPDDPSLELGDHRDDRGH